MASAPWPAPAKLNLFLHIVGRRPDGYHLLQTAFQFLNHSDLVYLSPRRDAQVCLLSPLPGVAAETDLTVRAARLLQHHCRVDRGIDIRLDKHLPMGGGLGGGSSDAATVLVALNALWRTGLANDELAVLGLQLGADVPVFVRGHAAWAEGVGEQLTPIDLAEPWYAVLVPPVTVSTADVFAAPELTRNTRAITISDFLSGAGHNDCEAVVRRRYPAVAEALDWLRDFAPARLTGTGACVFARFTDAEEARNVLGQLPRGWIGFVARGCNRSPLLARLEREVH